LFLTMCGLALWLNHVGFAPWLLCVGLALVVYMFYGWFSTVVGESVGGQYNEGVDRSFRMGMMWFIFSEVMFFAGLLRRALLRAAAVDTVAGRRGHEVPDGLVPVARLQPRVAVWRAG
jgi:hypothetical protein